MTALKALVLVAVAETGDKSQLATAVQVGATLLFLVFGLLLVRQGFQG